MFLNCGDLQEEVKKLVELKCYSSYKSRGDIKEFLMSTKSQFFFCFPSENPGKEQNSPIGKQLCD